MVVGKLSLFIHYTRNDKGLRLTNIEEYHLPLTYNVLSQYLLDQAQQKLEKLNWGITLCLTSHISHNKRQVNKNSKYLQ